MRTLILLLCALVTGCATGAGAALHAPISRDLALALPFPPGYPGTQTLQQTVRARYGERDAAFDAILSLSPDRVEIVVTAAGGPRVATITWSGEGVREEHSMLAPDGLSVENILADIFISLWPPEAVAAALPSGARLSIEADGARIIRHAGTAIIEVRPDPQDASRIFVRNLAFGYDLTIMNHRVE
jgi:hypothetical protein